MNIIKAYYYGFKESVRLPRPVFLIYFINLVLGIIVALPLWSLINSELGNTISMQESLANFRATIALDFLANNIAGLKVIVSQIWLIASIYWLISIFLAGGIIQTLNQDRFTMTSFFSGSGYNFFRFLGIGITMLFIQALLIVVIYVPAGFIISSLADNHSEEILINVFFLALGLHIFLAVILIMVSDYAKFYSFLYNSSNFIKSIIAGFKFVFRNFLKTTGLYLMMMIIPAALVYVYFILESRIGTHTGLGILLVLFVQQLLIILRIWFRIWIFASPLQLYTHYFLQQDDVKAKIAIIENWNQKALLQMEEDKRRELQRIKEAKMGAIVQNRNFSEDEILEIIEHEISVEEQKNDYNLESEICETTAIEPDIEAKG